MPETEIIENSDNSIVAVSVCIIVVNAVQVRIIYAPTTR
jgi:hypothetical protein